jgi:hypothetical protein
MERAFTLTAVLPSRRKTDLEMCGLSISMRHAAFFVMEGFWMSALLTAIELSEIEMVNKMRNRRGADLCAISREWLSARFWLEVSPQAVEVCVAEDEGFEPSIGFPIHAFQACALGRYANPPEFAS